MKRVLQWDRLPFLIAILILGVIVVRNAWMSDDIYITFRTLYNFDHGHGLVWNVTERVQTFTHPLWLICLAPVYMVVGHAYFVGLGMSLLFSFLAALRFPRIAGSWWGGALCLVLLFCSRAYVDFSTSGLENPLSHFLILVFVGLVLGIPFRSKQTGNPSSSPNFFWLGMVASLLVLNRMDHLLLVAPVIGYLFVQNRSWKVLKKLTLGALPFFLWEAFSLFYYGFPFPNTYYAKAMTGFPREWLLEQGLLYLWDSLTSDFLSLPLIVVVSVLVLIKGKPTTRWLLAGLWLYLLYVVWVGGDFMSGRFIASPFLLAVALLATLSWPRKQLALIVGVFALVSLFHPYHPVKVDGDYYADRRGNERVLYASGIVDEKGMAWQRSGLLKLNKGAEVLEIEREFANWGPDPGKILQTNVEVAVGMRGYRSGPNVFIVDELALTDPLLARLPALRVPYWRIGHFFRRIPAGYITTLETGENQLEDENLREYYKRLSLVTEGSLWSWNRMKQIVRFNLGLNAHLIPLEEYQTPTQSEIERF